MIELFLNFFTFKRFAIGTIVIFLAPLADVSPILFDGEVAQAKCIGHSAATSRTFAHCSIQFIVGDYEYNVKGDGAYEIDEELHVVYDKKNPFQFVELSFTGIYLNGLSIACIFLFVLWFCGYYSSLDRAFMSASTSEKFYDVLLKILTAFLIVVAGGIVLVLPCFIIATGAYEELVAWGIFVSGLFFTFYLIYKNYPEFSGKVDLFFKKKVQETTVDSIVRETILSGLNPPEKKSFFKNLFHTSTEHDFQRFSKKMFITGIIVILIAPAIASLAPFINAQHTEGKCVRYHYNENQNTIYSIIEFHPEESRKTVQYPDDLNLFEIGQKVDLLYIPKTPGKVLTLTLSSLYTNFWTGIAAGLFIIWIAAYYASRELNSN